MRYRIRRALRRIRQRAQRGVLVKRALLHGASKGTCAVVQVVADALRVNLHGSPLRAVLAVPTVDALAPANDERLPLLHRDGDVLRQAAVGLNGVPIGRALLPGSGSVLPARCAGQAEVHDGHAVRQGRQGRVGCGESADYDGVAHDISYDFLGLTPG